jgi:hypothetical protein
MKISVYTSDGRRIHESVSALVPVWHEGIEYLPTGMGHSVGSSPTDWSYVPA